MIQNFQGGSDYGFQYFSNSLSNAEANAGL